MTKEKDKDTDSKILSRLGEWEQREAALPQFVVLYAQLLRLQADVKSRLSVSRPELSQEAADARMRQGTPLLEFDDLSIDWPLLEEQLRAVADTLAEHLPEELGDPGGLRNVASNRALLQQVVGDWFHGLPLCAIAVEECVTEELLNIAVQAAVRPFLVAHSEATRDLVNQEIWRRRLCPACGGKADFAFLDRDRGARWLLCSRCDAEWLFQRLQCPYCGTQNQQALSYFTDEREVYRLYVCDECHSYIKAIDLRKAQEEVLLPLERFMSVDLDRQAVESGYRPG